MGTPVTNGYTGTFDFWFTLATAAGSDQLVVSCKLQDSADSYKGPECEFKAACAGDFSIDIWNDVSSGFVKTYFSGADIGMSGGTGTSAKLRMVLTITSPGLGKWTTVYSLQNLDTSNAVASVTLTSWTGQGWPDHIRMQEGPVNTITGNDGSISVDRITMGLLTAPATPTVISIKSLRSGPFRLEWPNGGTLLETTNVATGTWLQVSGATSPYTNSLTGSRSFYRIQVSP